MVGASFGVHRFMAKTPVVYLLHLLDISSMYNPSESSNEKSFYTKIYKYCKWFEPGVGEVSSSGPDKDCL